MSYYNRYKGLNGDDGTISPPFVKLDPKPTDKFIEYNVTRSRLDKICQEQYGSPFYGWLILMANPEYGGLEWNIIDGSFVRVPFPLDETLKEYQRKLKARLEYYGQ